MNYLTGSSKVTVYPPGDLETHRTGVADGQFDRPGQSDPFFAAAAQELPAGNAVSISEVDPTFHLGLHANNDRHVFGFDQVFQATASPWSASF